MQVQLKLLDMMSKAAGMLMPIHLELIALLLAFQLHMVWLFMISEQSLLRLTVQLAAIPAMNAQEAVHQAVHLVNLDTI